MSKESDVNKDVKIKLDYWKNLGPVLHWDRLNSGKIRSAYGSYVQLCKEGTPDFVAYVCKENTCWICFFETKKPSGGIIGDKQIEFSMLFNVVFNVVYELVTDASQVDRVIEKISNYSENTLKGIDF